jgi:hypothetical protein
MIRTAVGTALLLVVLGWFLMRLLPQEPQTWLEGSFYCCWP